VSRKSSSGGGGQGQGPKIDPRIQVIGRWHDVHVDGNRLFAPLFGGIFLAAYLEGDRFVFTGGRWGEHSLAADASITSADRLLAHWRGFVQNHMGIAS
jgi:hypothetical protein